MRLVKLLPGELALAEAGGAVQEISVALVSAEAGDLVLVHAGEAIARIEHAAAQTGAELGEVPDE
nr:HypC/HybG/HupF family hydrogenase formation chaperone [Streptomyces polyasparticus]